MVNILLVSIFVPLSKQNKICSELCINNVSHILGYTWEEASHFCNTTSPKSQLAEFYETDHFEVIRKLVISRAFPLADWWLGARDVEQEGTYQWERSRGEVAQQMWARNEPSHTVEHCVQMYQGQDGYLNDQKCAARQGKENRQIYPLCQVKNGNL